MSKIIAVLLICLFFTNAKAQSQYTLELKPINKKGSHFYYDFKRVHKGYSLQIPLQAVNDAEVNKSYNRYKTIRRIGRYTYFIPLIYLIAISTSVEATQPISHSEANMASALLWGAIFTNIGCNIISNAQLDKGIIRYNFLIMNRKALGLQIESLPDHQKFIGVGFSHKF